MRCACGIGVAVVLSLVPAWAAEEKTRPKTATLSRFNETTVRRAVGLALSKLALPGCSEIYGDFKLPNGVTPRSELVRLGIEPKEFLRRLLFVDGSRDRLCRTGRAVLTATPGSHVIRVCPDFARFQLRDPNLSASLIIHESLHALGLGEDPPSGRDITQRIERRCWKPAAQIP
jgi:hypothetical protein